MAGSAYGWVQMIYLGGILAGNGDTIAPFKQILIESQKLNSECVLSTTHARNF